MEADIKPDTKTRKRTEDAAADRAKHGDKSSSSRVDHDLMCLTGLGDDSTEPPAHPCRDAALVDKGAETPEPFLSAEEIRPPTAAGGLLAAGTASTATRTILPPPPLWDFCLIKEIKFRTTTSTQPYATHSSFRQMKVLETKSR